MAKQKSDLSRAFSEDGALKTHVGGQALIEGIMMRGKYNWAVAVRTPDGAIYEEEHELASGHTKNKWMYWPVVRGCRAMVESLMLGYKALEISAEHAFDGDEDSDSAADFAAASSESTDTARSVSPADSAPASSESADTACSDSASSADSAPASSESADKKLSSADEAPEANAAFGKYDMLISMVLGIVVGVVLFIVVPALLTNFMVGEYDDNTLVWNIVDGVLRVGVFVLYLWLIGRMEDIKRMFAYHGAEHKTIHCYEHGLELTPENARSFPRLHVRCGTAFLIMVLIIAIFVYTIVPLNALITAWGITSRALKLVLVILVRILFMPLIAGISYEITVKWAGVHPDAFWVKVVLWPGMQMQYLTTNEPDDAQLECAIAAMKRVLEREKSVAQSKK